MDIMYPYNDSYEDKARFSLIDSNKTVEAKDIYGWSKGKKIDIEVINNHFEMYAYNSLEFFGFVWVGLSVYTRWKYDKKHEHNMTKGKGAIIGVILLVLILLFLHL